MADRYFKIIFTMKRRSGMSVEDFRNYYESNHAPLAETYLSGVSRYIRRYANPVSRPEAGANNEPLFDVITELWFDNEDNFNNTVKWVATEVMPQEIMVDEEKFFDRASMRVATLVEYESDPSALT